MVLDDIADLFDELSTQYRHKDIARHFGRERKYVISVKKWLQYRTECRIYSRIKTLWI